MNTERAVFVYTTFPSVVEAEKAGRALVEQRLCACVNILPGMRLDHGGDRHGGELLAPLANLNAG